MSRYGILLGDVLDRLRELPDNSIDALFCDPPYGLSFMGHKWDYDVPSVEVWRECLRVMKPGACLLAFGGSRTFHRLAVNIEDAGFELRDTIMWIYASGFPKSQNVSIAIDKNAGAMKHRGVGVNVAGRQKGTEHLAVAGAVEKHVPVTPLAKQWEGYGSALKPAHEPIILARKPLEGTMASNVARWGTGGLNISGTRIGESGGTAKGSYPRGDSVNSFGRGINGACEVVQLDAGRWPANLILDEDAAKVLDATVSPTKSTPFRANDATGDVLSMTHRAAGGYTDSGGPSRFFYCSKVSKSERGAGCTHPTLKPIALTTYLAKLILPPASDAILLVPFSGAGSEVAGALLAGWPAVLGIERSEEYVATSHTRIPANCQGVRRVG